MNSVGAQLHYDAKMSVGRAATLSRTDTGLNPVNDGALHKLLAEIYVRQGVLVALVPRDRVLL